MKSIFSKTLYGIMLVVMTQQVSAFGLVEELAQQDAEFFKKGFNECDTDYLQQHVSKDLVFYHVRKKSPFVS